jgi:hypothetical protein
LLIVEVKSWRRGSLLQQSSLVNQLFQPQRGLTATAWGQADRPQPQDHAPSETCAQKGCHCFWVAGGS